MKLWLDAQISPAMAVWLRMRFDIDAVAVRDVGLRDAEMPKSSLLPRRRAWP